MGDPRNKGLRDTVLGSINFNLDRIITAVFFVDPGGSLFVWSSLIVYRARGSLIVWVSLIVS